MLRKYHHGSQESTQQSALGIQSARHFGLKGRSVVGMVKVSKLRSILAAFLIFVHSSVLVAE